MITRIVYPKEILSMQKSNGKVIFRFIRDEKHQYIEYIICFCSKKLVEKNLKNLKENLIIDCSCKLAYKLIKIDNVYIFKNSIIVEL
jgi:hypothetical protein